ncbi:MAG TPA: Abi family protein [Candidatus Limiplasma sp.]|nr:Abi family protein [Candidatus Limiplasma sp.]HRX08554.1 Abi family protein [Candidatus Limiplasma sp.]
MSISFPKAGLSIPDQLLHMTSKGLTVANTTKAYETLKHISFYRLRGYYIHCYNRQTKQFDHGITFEDIVALHDFDKELSALVLDVTSSIEISLRAYLANEICFASNGQDAMAYLDSKHFSSSDLFLSNLGKLSGDIYRSKEIFVQHFKDHYDCQVPIWAVMGIASFGVLSKLFKSLDVPIKRKITHDCYQRSTISWVESWLQAAVIIRNMCAHQSRLFNRKTGARPTILSVDDKATTKPETIYGTLLALKYLTEYSCGSANWTQKLKNLISKYSSVLDVSRLGFPSDWGIHLV